METTRLWLRQAKPTGLDTYLRIQTSEFVLRFNAMEPRTPDWAKSELERFQEDKNQLVLARKPDNQMIGMVTIHADDLRYGVDAFCLSYWLDEAHAQQGYMAEALGAVLPLLFLEREAEVASARVFSGNTASLRLLEKLGFQREGCLRKAVRGYQGIVHDDVLFSILREEWEQRQL